MTSSLFNRATRLAAVPVVLLAAVVVASSTAGATVTGAPTTSSVVAAARSAIGKQASVHLALSSRTSAKAVEEVVQADLAKSSGSETVSQGKETVTIKLTAADAYLSGNPSGLTKILGLTSAQVKKLGADWVFVKAGTTQYKDLATSMTISSVASVLPVVKGTKLYLPSPSGRKLYTLKWFTAATSSAPALASTLTISAVAPYLPVQETTTAPGGGRETVVFSKWGEPVVVSAPPARLTIPLSKVSG
ncbi:MAG: hypothetical protein ACP5VR_12645 [Acidimicrobiales bacterium]